MVRRHSVAEHWDLLAVGTNLDDKNGGDECLGLWALAFSYFGIYWVLLSTGPYVL